MMGKRVCSKGGKRRFFSKALLLTLTKKVRQQRIRTRMASPKATFLATSRQNARTSDRWGVTTGASDSSSSSRASRASHALASSMGIRLFTAAMSLGTNIRARGTLSVLR